MNKRVLVLAGPTGCGESTITNELIKRFPIFTRLVTATTRAPRNNEQQAIDYYFFSNEEFKQEIEKGNILEYTYVENRDVYYGAYKPDLEKKLAAGSFVIVNVDIVGARYYKEHYNATGIFILPDSLDILKERLKTRDADITAEELAKRLKNADDEMREQGPCYDFQVVNAQGRLEEAVQEIIDILHKEGYELHQAG